MTPAEIYADLRLQALDLKPFDPGTPASEPYGFINEFRQGEAVVTIAAFITGDVSLYLSTGGGIIGGVGKPELAGLARETIAALAPLALQLELSDVIDPPGAGEYCFYILTPAGRRMCSVSSSGRARADGPEVKLIRLGGALLKKIHETSVG